MIGVVRSFQSWRNAQAPPINCYQCPDTMDTRTPWGKTGRDDGRFHPLLRVLESGQVTRLRPEHPRMRRTAPAMTVTGWQLSASGGSACRTVSHRWVVPLLFRIRFLVG